MTDRPPQQVATETFEQLWAWGCAEAKASRMDPADVSAFQKVGIINAIGGDREDWGHAQGQAIRGIPFSKPMQRYLSGGLDRGMVKALAAVRPLKGEQVTRARRQMWKVVHAVVSDGETSTEACRARLGLDDFAFRSAALNGLLMLRSALEHTV